MPYIPQCERETYQEGLQDLRTKLDGMSKGHLTYCLYALALAYLTDKCIDSNTTSYHIVSETVGALEDAAHELRRRVLDPYEDQKRRQNGDIAISQERK